MDKYPETICEQDLKIVKQVASKLYHMNRAYATVEYDELYSLASLRLVELNENGSLKRWAKLNNEDPEGTIRFGTTRKIIEGYVKDRVKAMVKRERSTPLSILSENFIELHKS